AVRLGACTRPRHHRGARPVPVAYPVDPRERASLPQHLAPLDCDEVGFPAKETGIELGCGLKVRHGNPGHHLVAHQLMLRGRSRAASYRYLDRPARRGRPPTATGLRRRTVTARRVGSALCALRRRRGRSPAARHCSFAVGRYFLWSLGAMAACLEYLSPAGSAVTPLLAGWPYS